MAPYQLREAWVQLPPGVSLTCCASRASPWRGLPAKVDMLGLEPRASRMLSGCDTTTPHAQMMIRSLNSEMSNVGFFSCEPRIFHDISLNRTRSHLGGECLGKRHGEAGDFCAQAHISAMQSNFIASSGPRLARLWRATATTTDNDANRWDGRWLYFQHMQSLSSKDCCPFWGLGCPADYSTLQWLVLLTDLCDLLALSASAPGAWHFRRSYSAWLWLPGWAFLILREKQWRPWEWSCQSPSFPLLTISLSLGQWMPLSGDSDSDMCSCLSPPACLAESWMSSFDSSFRSMFSRCSLFNALVKSFLVFCWGDLNDRCLRPSWWC